MTINSDKREKQKKQMSALGLREEDIFEQFIKGSGPGGQKINKTSSCVYLRHLLSGLEVKCQQTRSQVLNRYYARQQLIELLEERVLGEKTRKKQEAEKIRRQKRRRTRRQKARILLEKKKTSEKKQLRRPVNP